MFLVNKFNNNGSISRSYKKIQWYVMLLVATYFFIIF